MKNTIISFIVGATIATGVATTTDLVKDAPTAEPTKEVKDAILTKHPYITKDKTECEKIGGSLEVNVNTKYQNTPTTTEPIETVVMECLK